MHHDLSKWITKSSGSINNHFFLFSCMQRLLSTTHSNLLLQCWIWSRCGTDTKHWTATLYWHSSQNVRFFLLGNLWYAALFIYLFKTYRHFAIGSPWCIFHDWKNALVSQNCSKGFVLLHFHGKDITDHLLQLLFFSLSDSGIFIQCYKPYLKPNITIF